MELDIISKQGKLQVDGDQVRVVPLFKKQPLWSVPRADVTGITDQPSSLGAVNVSIHTTQGIYQAETVSKPNYEKLKALFASVNVTSAGKEWYCDPSKSVYIAMYTNEKQMQKEVQAASQYGWVPQSTAGTAGHINLGRTLIGASLTGGVSLLFGGSRSKDKVTITFVRQTQQR